MVVDAWVPLAGEWLHGRVSELAAGEPRFWTVPPEQHVSQLLLHASFMAFWASLSAPGLSPAGSLVGRPTRGEQLVGHMMLAFATMNVFKKVCLSSGLLDDLIEMANPCHVYTLMAALAMLSTSRQGRETVANLLVYCAWMPLLAMMFPDVDDIMRIASPVVRGTCLALFWLHHVAILLVPVFIAYFAKLGRFRVPPVTLDSFAQYAAFANAYIGVALCIVAVLVGRNINYSLWPPPLPPAVEALLGGSYYRVTVGLLLTFVAGPLMRLGYYSLARTVIKLLTK